MKNEKIILNRLGIKFAINTLIMSFVIPCLIGGLIVWYVAIRYENDAAPKVFIVLAITALAISVVVTGILELVNVTKDKTNCRGLHIANGIMMILWIVIGVAAAITTFILSIIMVVKENKKEEYALPNCEKGSLITMGGCNTCDNCSAQLKCGL